MKKRVVNSILLSAATAGLLIGCGGSSSGGTTGPTSKSYSGSVIDGYIKGATVCLDLSLDGVCQQDEPTSTPTDETGNYSISVTAEQQNHVNFDKAPIIAVGGTDVDTGKKFEGKLEAPKTDEGTANLTPITTLVSKMVKKAIDSESNVDEETIKNIIKAKKDAVKKVLKIDDVDADFVKSGNKNTNKAALQIQKTAELLAQAANDGNTSSSEVLEKVIETFAQKIEDLEEADDDTKFNVENLVNETITEAQDSNSELVKLTGKVITTNVTDEIKKVSKNIDTAFDKFEENLADGENFDDLVDKVLVLVNEQVNDLDKAIEDDTIEDLVIEEFGDDDNVFTQTRDEIRERGLEKELDFLGVSGASDVAKDLVAETDPKVYPYSIYDVFLDEQYTTLQEKYPEVKLKLEEYFAKVEQEEKEEEILTAKKGLLLTENATFINFWKEKEYENGELIDEYAYSSFTFDVGEKKEIEDIEYIFDNASKSWAKDDETDNDIVLTSTGWKKESELESTFTVNDENVYNFSKYNENITIISETDITEKYLQVINKEIDLPTGSKEYAVKIERASDSYGLYEKVKSSTPSVYIDSFSGLIEKYCGNNTFLGKQSLSTGIAFGGAGETLSNYTCDSDATSGKLIEVNHKTNEFKDAGTWEIKQVNGVDILVTKPNDVKKYSWDGSEEYTIFASYDDGNGELIYRGDLEPQGEIEKLVVYNETAGNAIKDIIKTHLTALATESSYFYALGKKWKNYKADNDERYTVFGNDARKAHDKDRLWVNAEKKEDTQSRAEARKSFDEPKGEVRAELRFKTSNSVSKGNMMAIMDDVNESEDSIYVVVQLRNNRINYYAEQRDSNGDPIENALETSGNIAENVQTTFYNGIDGLYGTKITINGTKIEFRVAQKDSNGDIVKSYYKEIDLGSTFKIDKLGFDKIRFRAETNLKNELADGETFENIEKTRFRVHAVSTEKYEPSTTESTPDDSISIENKFNGISLKDTTSYWVWFGTGTNAQGDDIDNVAVVEKVVIDAQGNGVVSSILNGANENVVIGVKDNKIFAKGANESDFEVGYNKYVSGSVEDGCIKTAWINPEDSNDNNIDLMFFNQDDAEAFADNLTSTITACPTTTPPPSLEDSSQSVATMTISTLFDSPVLSIGDDWYDKITVNGSTLSGIEYEKNDQGSFVQDGTFTLTVTPDQNDPYSVAYVDPDTNEEGVLTLDNTEKVLVKNGIEYSTLYKVRAEIRVTKEATVLEWDRWDWDNPTYPSGDNSVAINDTNSLVAGLTTSNMYTTLDDDTKVMLLPNDNGTKKVVNAVQDGTHNNGDPIYKRGTTQLGTWQIDNGRVVIGTPNEKVFLRAGTDNGTNYIESADKLKVGATEDEYFIKGSEQELTKYISSLSK